MNPEMMSKGMHEGPATSEATSIFLRKGELGTDVKKGDMLSLKILDVDPETGDIEAQIASGGMADEPSSFESDFDKAMPPGLEEEEQDSITA